MMTSLSPMRKNHFSGELVDEKKSIRFVGFDRAKKQQLDALNEKKLPVLLKNCDVQLSDYTKSLEVIVKGYTKISQSQKVFNIDDPASIGTTTTTLDHLCDMEEYDKVNLKVKVVSIGSPQFVGSGKTKQEIVLADQTGTATLTLWEEDIDMLTLAACYSMKRLHVRTFKETYYLSLPATGAIITKTDDIADIPEDFTTASHDPVLMNVQICGIKEFEVFKQCLACDGSLANEPNDDSLLRCQKCQVQLKASCCTKVKLMAKILVLLTEGEANTVITLTGYGDILQDIAGPGEQVTRQQLFQAKPFNLTYNNYNIITNVTRD